MILPLNSSVIRGATVEELLEVFKVFQQFTMSNNVDFRGYEAVKPEWVEAYIIHLGGECVRSTNTLNIWQIPNSDRRSQSPYIEVRAPRLGTNRTYFQQVRSVLYELQFAQPIGEWLSYPEIIAEVVIIGLRRTALSS